MFFSYLLMGLLSQVSNQTYEDLYKGPLSIRSNAFMLSHQLTYQPRRIGLLGPYDFSWQNDIALVNQWGDKPSFLIDGEWLRWHQQGSLGLPWDFELTFNMDTFILTGGIFDNIIIGFHQMINEHDDNRENNPRNQLRVENRALDGNRVYLKDTDAGLFLGYPKIGLYKRLTDACSKSRIVVEMHLQLPMTATHPVFQQYHAMGLMGLALLHPLYESLNHQLYFLFAAGFSTAPQRHHLGMPMFFMQKYLQIGFEWQLLNNWHIILQYLAQEGSVIQSIYRPLNFTTHEINLGLRYAPFREGPSFEWAFLENMVNFSNTADVGMMLGIDLHYLMR